MRVPLRGSWHPTGHAGHAVAHLPQFVPQSAVPSGRMSLKYTDIYMSIPNHICLRPRALPCTSLRSGAPATIRSSVRSAIRAHVFKIYRYLHEHTKSYMPKASCTAVHELETTILAQDIGIGLRNPIGSMLSSTLSHNLQWPQCQESRLRPKSWLKISLQCPQGACL